MDRGLTIENPYASVTIPRAQLQEGFLRYYLGDNFTSDTILFNPSVLPTYSAAQAKEEVVAQNGQKKEEAWARPTNPYASLKGPKAGSPEPEPFRWKGPEAAAPEPHSNEGSCCCCCCCSSSSSSSCCQKCCPCCRKCACVIS